MLQCLPADPVADKVLARQLSHPRVCQQLEGVVGGVHFNANAAPPRQQHLGVDSARVQGVDLARQDDTHHGGMQSLLKQSAPLPLTLKGRVVATKKGVKAQIERERERQGLTAQARSC